MALTSTILMIRPANFGFNPETAANNYFQSLINTEADQLQKKALEEFDQMVQDLSINNIEVIVINDTDEPPKPSAIFPNNWLSTSPDGNVFVYPMFAPNRRAEKREDILKLISENFIVKDLQDWSEYEVEGKFLEGTGSMVIDHDNKVIYACYSPRTDISVLEKYANRNQYRAIVFLATDKNNHPVYHTNVVMALGENFAILCEEAIEEEWELIAVKQLLESTGHEIIRITIDQVHSFAGNMLQVKNNTGEKILVLSQTAFDSLTAEQKKQLSLFSKLLPIDVSAIEQAEGGSVRCMMTELFLKKKQ
jgi:hypothetical protein